MCKYPGPREESMMKNEGRAVRLGDKDLWALRVIWLESWAEVIWDHGSILEEWQDECESPWRKTVMAVGDLLLQESRWEVILVWIRIVTEDGEKWLELYEITG